MSAPLEQCLQEIQGFFQQGKIETAVANCRKAIATFPKNAEPYLVLARLEQAVGNFQEMDQAFKQACKRLPQEAPLYAMHGDACMDAQRFAEAVGPYRMGMRLQPKQLVWRVRLASALQELPDGIDEAITLHQSVVEFAPKEAVAHYNLGTALKRKRLFDEALKCYREAATLAPNDFDIQSNVANLLFEIEKYEEAVTALEKVIQLNSEYAPAYEQLSYCNKRLLRPGDSVKAAEKYLRLVGNTPDALSLLASAELSAGEYQTALTHCDLGLQQNPRNRRLLSDKTIALSSSGRKEEAQALFNLDELLWIDTIDTPSGYGDVQEFNRVLLEDINQHSTLDFSGVSHSCYQGATSDELFTRSSGPLQYLINAINQMVAVYRHRLGQNNNHPWLANLPEQSTLNLSGWVTKLNSQGYQRGHMHPTGWISGVYYLSLPPEVGGQAHAGCIEFGRAPFFYPEGDQGEIKIVEPREGMLVLFPSYFYHRTMPFESHHQRITIAFDFRAADLS